MAFNKEEREIIFKKAGGKCQACGDTLILENHEKGEDGAWEAHHKVSKASDGKDIPSNGKALCIECHEKTYTYGKKL